MACQCDRKGYYRSLDEDGPGLPNTVAELGTTAKAFLGCCRECGAWWERLPHETYGYAWYRTQQGYWNATDEALAIAGWASARREQGM